MDDQNTLNIELRFFIEPEVKPEVETEAIIVMILLTYRQTLFYHQEQEFS